MAILSKLSQLQQLLPRQLHRSPAAAAAAVWKEQLLTSSRHLATGISARLQCNGSNDAAANDNIVRSEFPDVHIPRDISVPAFIWNHNVDKFPHKIALVDGVSEKSYTFEEASDECKKVGFLLQAEFGVTKGDVVGFFLPSCPEYLTCLTGVIGMGATATTINPAYTVDELKFQLQLSKPKLMLTNPDIYPVVKEALAQIGNDSKVVIIGSSSSSSSDGDQFPAGTYSFDHLVSQVDAKADAIEYVVDPEGVAMLPHSSGTTGLPKGVMLTSNNLIANVSQADHAQGLDFIRPTTDDFQEKTVCVMPLFHAFGSLVTSLPTLRMGGQLVTLPKFEPERFIAALAKHRPSFLHIAPPLVAFLANHPEVTPAHLASVRDVVVAAAPFGEALANKYLAKAPHTVFKEAWGMTELSPLATVTPSSKSKIGSCGVLVPNTWAKIVDTENGQPLGPNQLGELCIKGPQVMKGYLGNEEATRSTIKDGGWLHSGDIACYDDQNRFYIVDRLKELIKVKGFQVAPAELENLIRMHPDILDVGVVGVPDERKGEAPFAFLVAKPGGKVVTADQIHRFVSDKVTEYKHLTGGIRFIDAIPKNPSGKILRRELRKLI